MAFNDTVFIYIYDNAKASMSKCLNHADAGYLFYHLRYYRLALDGYIVLHMH